MNNHIIFESVLMLFTQNYQNQSMLVETTAYQIWVVFETYCSIGLLYKGKTKNDAAQRPKLSVQVQAPLAGRQVLPCSE